MTVSNPWSFFHKEGGEIFSAFPIAISSSCEMSRSSKYGAKKILFP